MIKQNKLQNLNFQNLLSVSKILRNIEHFIFYGSLLGIIRDKNIITGDDDVDFLINYKFKNLVLKKMKLNKSFELNKKVSNNYFIQFIKKKQNIMTFVDFYFYIKDPKKNYIIEKHNFLSNINDKKFAIHIPNKIIFPIIKDNTFSKFNIPNNPKAICRFLYGDKWSKPLKKNTGYRMEIIKNKPLLIKRSFLGSLTRLLKEILSINSHKKIY
tara:strand:+ start:822 stop:1460 length:639 start_codon:yes stop_codon:yes gene_type:complete